MAENSREALMRNLQTISFVVDDLTLYLQTHPTDRQALQTYQKYMLLKKEAEKAYTDKYGPLRQDNVYVTDRWTWADMPWPWERQG